MEIIDNVNKTLKEDLITEIHNGSKISIAAASFSIYAFAELKKKLKKIDGLRFVFTSPKMQVIDKFMENIFLPQIIAEKVQLEISSKIVALK